MWLHIPSYIPWDWFLLTDEHTQYHNYGPGSLTFKNRASYIYDGRTATLQMLHFMYFFQQL
jgi:hypothetical protein